MTFKTNRIFRIGLIVSTVGLLAACNGYDNGTSGNTYGSNDVCEKIEPTPVEVSTPATAPETAACEAAGGSVSLQGLAQRNMCVLPYCDAGKVCSDSSECIGKCFTTNTSGPGTNVTGECQPDSSPFGCRTEVTAGTRGPTICVD